MKKIIFLITLSIISFGVQAQYNIQSKIIEKRNNHGLEMASVRLLHPSDSTLEAGVLSDSAGQFSLQNIKPGTYLLNVTNIGYNDHNQKVIVIDKNLILPAIAMEENVKMLQEVKVNGTAVQVVVKNDTIEYNAQAFKTGQNAVVEDLLKKMPGVDIASDGKITVNGQEVKKILVDGKKFFGDDIEMSTKNIPADMIDKLQVVDQKSEMAQLTGFEDNDTERVINLTLKKNKKQGVFGNVQAGAGMDVNPELRYDGNAFLKYYER